jgi:uncharacterized damage-inducible protein DinB
VLTNSWNQDLSPEGRPKVEALRLWDEHTKELGAEFPKIPAARFHETMKAFGQWELPVHELIMYIVDNEIHHRAQGYVYLRALGIEPPHFWERK